MLFMKLSRRVQPDPGFVAGFSAIVIQGNSLTFSCCCTSIVTVLSISPGYS